MWKRPIVLTIAVVILLRQIIPISTLIRDFPLNDFSVYLDGTKATLRGENPYTQKFFDRYNYPPAATIFFVPLTKIDVNAAESVFTLFSIIALWFVVAIVLSEMSLGNKPTIKDSIGRSAPSRMTSFRSLSLHWTIKLLLFSLILKSFPVKLTLVLGQINIIILFLVMSSWFMEKKKRSNPFHKSFRGRQRRPWESELVSDCHVANAPRNDKGLFEAKSVIAGILLGLATAIKLTPGPLILYFLVKRKIKFAIGWLGVFGGLGIGGIVLFGWEQTRYFYFVHLPKLLSETTTETLNLTYMNQSLLALLGRLGIFGELGATIRYGVVVVSTVIIMLVLRYRHSGVPRLTRDDRIHIGEQDPIASPRHDVASLQVVEDSDSGRDDPRKDFQLFSAFLIIVFLLLPSFVWQHHFVALIPAWLVFVSQAVKKPRSLWTLAAIVGYVLLNVSIKDPYLPARIHPLLASHFTLTAFLFLTLLIFPRPNPQKQ